MVKISVIIPTCNRAQYLNRTLSSLISQKTDIEYEVLVLDDFGLDEKTKKVVSFWQQKKKVIRYLNPADFGMPKGRTRIRNLGIQQSKGEILVFLDDDMIVTPDFIKEHYGSHAGRIKNNVVIGYRYYLKTSYKFLEYITPVSIIGDPSIINRLPWIKDERESVYKICQDRLGVLSAPWALLFSNNFSVRKKMLMNVGGKFNKTFEGDWGAEDIELGYRLHVCGGRFILNRKAAGYHQWHYVNWRKNINSLRKNLNKFFLIHPSLEAELYLDYVDIGLENYLSDLSQYLSINGQYPSSVLDGSSYCKYVQSHIAHNTDEKILLVGAGNGNFFKKFRVNVCVDQRESVIHKGKIFKPSIKWHHLTGIHLPYKDRHFDCVVINDFLNILKPYHRKMVFSECLRVTKSCVYFATTNQNFENICDKKTSYDGMEKRLEQIMGLENYPNINIRSHRNKRLILFSLTHTKLIQSLTNVAETLPPKLAFVIDSGMEDTFCDNAIELALCLTKKGCQIVLEMEDYKTGEITKERQISFIERFNLEEQEILKRISGINMQGERHLYPYLSLTGRSPHTSKKIEWVRNKAAGTFSAPYIHALNDQVDLIWCPSQSYKEFLVKSGCNAEKIEVFPVGIPKDLMQATSDRSQKEKTFRFVAVGTIEKSDGLDIALQAFCEGFSKIKKVELTIRLLPLKHRNFMQKQNLHNRTAKMDYEKYTERADALSEYRVSAWHKYARLRGIGANRFKIEYLSEKPREWFSYFKNADCYLQPHRADFTGQRILQAMGLGLPVIATSRYLPDEIRTRGMNYFVPSIEVSAAESEWGNEVIYASWAEPSVTQLIKFMRHVYQNKNEARLRADKARTYALSSLSWDKISERVIIALKKLDHIDDTRKKSPLALLFNDLKESDLISIEEEAYERR